MSVGIGVSLAVVLVISSAAAMGSRPARARGPELSRFSATQLHMGVQFSIVLYAPDKEAANRAFRAAFARIGELDGILSDYKEESELSRLSAAAPHERGVPVGPDLWNILAASQALSRRTDGAFDLSVGPLTKLWRRARRQSRLPPDDLLAEARASVGYPFIELDACARTARLTRGGMKLDAGGIAVGYAVDEAMRMLRGMGWTRVLVNGSGDIAVGDPPPGETGWAIDVAPLAKGGPASRRLLLANRAVSTSGDAFQYLDIDGRRYSHILDPRTGVGLTDRSGVVVVARDCMSADSLATAVSVLGPAKGLALIDETPGAAALIVRAPDDKVEVHESRRFADIRQAD
jgi:thiamine biosynthesis lipoprotein